jgi:hypothetical protein
MKQAPAGSFYLSKWFLDFVSKEGAAMIFYSAKLKWNSWSAAYTSWLQHYPQSGINFKFRFTNVQTPYIKDNTIGWNDSRFGISGTWKASADMIQARIYDSAEGFLDWKCYQPASEVQLVVNGNIMKGTGYTEQLILTALPWKIPMDELRWGRFGSEENNMVWIEIKEKEKRRWLWLNGEKIGDCIIEDGQIRLPEKELVLNLDQSVILESEKKIFTIVEKLLRYIPGFNKVMPLNFLMADEFKWLSNGQLKEDKKTLSTGIAIHELVNFKRK